MTDEGTPGKWSLWATRPDLLGGMAELYPTAKAAAARADALRAAGYEVQVTLSKLPKTC